MHLLSIHYILLETFFSCLRVCAVLNFISSCRMHPVMDMVVLHRVPMPAEGWLPDLVHHYGALIHPNICHITWGHLLRAPQQCVIFWQAFFFHLFLSLLRRLRFSDKSAPLIRVLYNDGSNLCLSSCVSFCSALVRIWINKITICSESDCLHEVWWGSHTPRKSLFAQNVTLCSAAMASQHASHACC